MSAMPEESDVDTEEDGSPVPDSEEVSDSGGQEQNVDQAEGISFSVAGILREESERQKVEGDSKSNGKVFSGYHTIEQRPDQIADGDSELVIRPGDERPSSADGSLSTPDDTPSLKVRPRSNIWTNLRRMTSNRALSYPRRVAVRLCHVVLAPA